MKDETFKLFLAVVIAILLLAIGWAVWDHHYHERHDDIHIDIPGIHIEWDDHHRHRRP